MSTADKVISVVKAEVGYHEGFKNGHWTNQEKYADKVPGLEWVDNVEGAWCAVFAAWGFQEGKAPKGSYPVTASCAAGVAWYKSRKRFSQYPAIGAQVFYGAGGGTHTGIVTGFDSEFVYSVEGNTNLNGSPEGDGVYAKKHLRKDGYVYGYGYPEYAEGIVSADPAWKDESPKPSKPTEPKPAKPAPKPTPKVTVDLSNVVAAAKRDPNLHQGGTTHKGDAKVVEAALSAEGLLDARWVDGSFGTLSRAAYAKWQKKSGVGGPYDGVPGIASLKKLGAEHKFSVKA